MPSFYEENNTPRATDTLHRIEQKILGQLDAGGGGGAGKSGTSDPEGVTQGVPGTTFYNTSNGSFWVKETGTGTTGWVALIV